MITLKGSTSSLIVLLLHAVLTVQDNVKPIVLPNPYALLLPTKAGISNENPSETVGIMPKEALRCGKSTVNTDSDLGLSYKPSSFELRLDCAPHPERVLVATGNAAFSAAPTGPVDLKKCFGTYLCSTPSHLPNVFNGPTPDQTPQAAKPHDGAFPNVCEKGSQNVLFSNELGCDRGGVHQKDDIAGGFRSVPRWLTTGKERFRVVRPFTSHGAGKFHEQDLEWTNVFLELPETTSNQKWRECKATCDRGSIVKMNMGAATWKMLLYLRADTPGLKMCINADHHSDIALVPKCRKKFEMYLLPQQGIVVWPKSGRSSLMTLKPKSLKNSDTFVIEIGYGWENNKGEMKGEFYVANQYREMVVSDTDGYSPEDASKISLFFAKPDSLIRSGGVESAQIESGFTYIDDALAADLQSAEHKSKKAGAAVDKGNEALDDDDAQEKTAVQNEVTTTPRPDRVFSSAASGGIIVSTDNTNDAVYAPGKWWTWGIYIGFIIGTILGMAIIGGIYYFLRRTVFSFWYRGMYKRYGCDASGTTGGITGIGFGATTTGAMTVQGTTAGGTTRGGTTTSGMTTGGTTSRGSSTTGASTIAM